MEEVIDEQNNNKRPLFGWLENILLIRRMMPPAPKGIERAGELVDIFASFVALDSRVDLAEAEIALDLLRHTFPEADHSWLARRLHRALAIPRAPEKVAENLRNALDDDEKTSLGLQLFLLVGASGSFFRGSQAFNKVMQNLNAKDAGAAIMSEMKGEPHTVKLPFDKVTFGHADNADVKILDQNQKFAFSAYRTKQLIVIRNTGIDPIWISGSSLQSGQLIRLRKHQSIALPGWVLTAEDISFFLNCARTGHRQALYLNEDNNSLTVNRIRSRQSAVQLDFGFNVQVKALIESSLRLPDGKPMVPGEIHELPVQAKLLLENGAPTHLEDLRKQAMASGSRFKMNASGQDCIVSNDSSALKRGDVLLTPGLARRVILRINYNPQTAEGYLSVLDAERVVMVNGHPIRENCKLTDGALIRLSPNQAVRCRFSEGLLNEERAVIRELSVDNLSHKFSADKVVLDNVSFTVKRGEMLCIMGPSGCGKSTLLAHLASHLRPRRGHVRLNNVSLYENRNRLAQFIASMPQEEALNPQLTVREHLINASTIRKPHLSSTDHSKRVDAILAELALQPLAHRKVGSPGEKTLSGGERGRLNLGLDLSSPAEIFLFDEPISGLSSKDSEHVTESLHTLSRDNIVIASLHRPGAKVLRLFDKVLMLDQGGRVTFFGTPMEMGKYFREACNELQILSPQKIKDQQVSADFVFDVIETPLYGPAGRETESIRRFPPTFWQERFEGNLLVNEVARGDQPDHSRLGDTGKASDNTAVPSPGRRQRLSEWNRLLRTHFRRSLRSKFRNRGTIYSILLEAPLLAALIGTTLRASPEGSYAFHSGLHMPVYIFLTATIGMFLGLTNSATEILRDSPILRRERNCRSGTLLYVISKFSALAVLAVLQCCIYTWVGHSMLEVHGMFLLHWGWMTVITLCGTAMAMVVSAVVTTERAALSSVPLLLVPQILLAGALVSFEEMNRGMFEGADDGRAAGVEPIPARLMPLRYAYEGMMVNQAAENPFEKNRRKIQARIDPLKKRVETQLAGDKSKKLNPKESARLDILKEALRRLMAAEAEDYQKARDLAEKITRTGRKKSMTELLAISPYPDDEGTETQPLNEFFVNSRTDLLVGKAELDRIDWRQESKRNIFLAEWKYWLGVETKTATACLWVLYGCIALCLSITTTILLIRKHRVK